MVKIIQDLVGIIIFILNKNKIENFLMNSSL